MCKYFCKFVFVLCIVSINFIIILLLSFSGGGGWLRVLRQAAAGDPLLCPQLLWRIRQRWCHDECGRDSHVLFPDPQGKKVLLLFANN